MSKKVTIIIIVFLIILLTVVGCVFTLKRQLSKNTSDIPIDISKVTNSEIIDLLRTNNDSLDYIEKCKDFKIEKKSPLTKESILEGQNGENFKEVYQGLDLEDNRYLRADLMNAAGSWGLITVLDFKTKSVIKAFGLMLISAGVDVE